MSGHSIELEHIIKSYSGKPVIRDVSLALPANTTTAIVGESGSGKSTLLQLINGLVLPDSGSVRKNYKNYGDTILNSAEKGADLFSLNELSIVSP